MINIIITFHSLFIQYVIRDKGEETEERDIGGETYEQQTERDRGEETEG